VELSDHARLLDRIRHLPEGRLDRVEAVRAQIADGSYETDDKLTAAVSRMLEDLDIE
jgi:negative regulator of flagellin synthesis FlgM